MDFNNDRYKDFFVVGGNATDNAELISRRQSRQPNLAFLNPGGGKFHLQVLRGETLHRGAVSGDFDRDGCMDAVVTSLNEAPLVLRNARRGRPLAGPCLEDTRSNRHGIGARIHIVVPSGEQWNRLTTSAGYAGSSGRTMHFGLGADTA